MPKVILIASDLSVRSERALRRAFRLAEQHGAQLNLLTVVDGDLPLRLVERLTEDAHEELRQLCGAISSYPVEILVRTGEPVQVIADTAGNLFADLIVLGVHRPRPIWDLFAGTTMERIVRATMLPVLLVKEAVVSDYGKLLGGVDLSPASAAALNAGAELAPGAEIVAFHAFQVPFRGFIAPNADARAILPFRKEARQELDAWWDATPLPENCARPEPVDMGRGPLLVRMLAEHAPDLLLIGAHGRPALSPSVLGGFTEEILRDPPCDVLVVRR